MYKKTKNHEEDTMIFFLVFSYYNNQGDSFPVNQELLGSYLNLCRVTINRHIQKMLDFGGLCLADKRYFNVKKGTHWKNNIYTVNRDKLNQYLIDNYGYDCLANITAEEPMFFDFLDYKKKFYASPEELQEMYEEDLKDAKQIAEYTKTYADFVEKLDELNADPQRKIKLDYLREGRKRLTSPLCGTKNPEKHKDNARAILLDKQYDGTPLQEFDTNASIYRLSYNLGHNKCLPHDVDMYEILYNACGWNKPWSPEVRKMFKDLIMPIYMKESSLKYRTFIYERRQRYLDHCKKSDKDYVVACQKVEKYFDDTLLNITEKVRVALHEVLNLKAFCQAEIFIYESNLHILMLEKLKSRGIIASNVYDGFYVPEGSITKQEFEDLYDEATRELKKNLKSVKKIKKVVEEV